MGSYFDGKIHLILDGKIHLICDGKFHLIFDGQIHLILDGSVFNWDRLIFVCSIPNMICLDRGARANFLAMQPRVAMLLRGYATAWL